MFFLLVVLTGVVFATTLRVLWLRFGDPLHPGMLLCFALAYSYSVEPLILESRIFLWFPDEADLNSVAWLNLLSVCGLSLGLLGVGSRLNIARLDARQSVSIPEQNVIRIAVLLIAISLTAFVIGLLNAGGFVAAYSRSKGGGTHYSGYIAESVNLGLVAALMLGVSRWKRGLEVQHWTLLIIALIPNLAQGTFGGRRGPLFLGLGAIFLVWLVSTPKRVRFLSVALRLFLIAFLVVVVWSQRRHMYLGSDSNEFRWENIVSILAMEKEDQGNNYIYGTGLVIATSHAGKYTWGREMLVNLVIRPIPKQLWPDKYRDVGATWITEAAPGYGNLTPDDWIHAVGWLPFAGSSAGLISDLFGEYSWMTILACYVIGRGLRGIYIRHCMLGGVWSVLLLEASSLSIYLATQSFSAFYHRFLLLAVPTWLVWRYIERKKAGYR